MTNRGLDAEQDRATVDTNPDAPAARWSYRRELTGAGPHGHPVSIVTGVVDTPNGPAPALLVGVCVVLLDELLTTGLITNVLTAKKAAGLDRDEDWR